MQVAEECELRGSTKLRIEDCGARFDVPPPEWLSERESQAEAELPLVVFGAGDFQEASTAQIIIGVVHARIVKMRAIEKIGGVDAEL